MSNYSIKYSTNNGINKINVTGLPDKPIRCWDSNIEIKFYKRKNRNYPTFNCDRISKHRFDTQLYINKKYFLNFKQGISEDTQEKIVRIIKDLYMLGVNLDKIKEILKKLVYKER